MDGPEAAAMSQTELPREFQAATLRRRGLQALAALGVLLAIVLLAPGLGQVRDLLADADPGWITLAIRSDTNGRKSARACRCSPVAIAAPADAASRR